MNVKLIAAAIAALGLAACSSPDVTPKASIESTAPVTSSEPAQPAEEQKLAKADQPATAPAAQEEKKDEGAAPTEEAKKDEGEKKAD